MIKRTGSRYRQGLLCASALTAMAMAGHAQAQATSAPPPGASSALEEVVVTARKQSEKLQDVPVTVSALTEKTIEKLQIKSIFDLATVTPGVYFGTSGGRNGGNKLQIRNFSTGTAGPSKASVFIDGAYSPGDYASIPLANLERIEVLKGPQSAYFGRATFVGAVNFITKDPTNDFSGKIDLVGAELGEHDYTGYISVPILKDKLATQVTFRDYSFDGPSKWRTTDGYHLGDQSTKSISSKTVYKPIDDLTLRFTYTHVKDDDHIPPVLYADLNSRVAIARPGGTFGYYFNGATKYNFSTPSWGLPTATVAGLTAPGIRHEQDRFAFSYDWKVMGHSISGYVTHSHEKFDEQLDGSLYLSGTSPIVIPNATGVPTTATFAPSYFRYALSDNDTQAEIRLTSPQNQALRYTVGFNYSDIEGHNQLFTLGGVSIYNQNTYGGSFLNPALDKSVFGGIYWDFLPKATLSFEGRYQQETIEAATYSTATATYGQPLTDVKADFDAFLPRVNLQYRFTPNFQVYLVYAEGNNPGGFQPITPAQAAANGIPYAYAEESIKNYEGGIKSSWLGGRLVLDVAAFHMDFDNEQLSQTTPVAGTPTGFASVYLPGVASHVDGFEFEGNAALTHDLQVRGTVGYGKAKYDSFCSAPYAALTGIQTGLNCRSVAGKQQEGTPALQTSLSGDYTHTLRSGLGFYIRGDWEYQSKVYNEEWDQSWVPAHSVFNARIGLEGEHWTLEGFVRNLTDDANTARSTRVTDGRAAAVAASYPTLGGFSQGIAGQQTVAGTAKKPRQFGVRLGYRW